MNLDLQRAWFKQALAFAPDGREILGGLTRKEIEWYLFEATAWIQQGLSETQAGAEVDVMLNLVKGMKQRGFA